MRSSSHSSHSRSHSSMHSHRSSLSSHRSSSLTSSHMRHSNNMGSHSSRNRPGHHHGISDAHAFAVGRATGVNINASARGAAGAALHRSSESRSRRRRRESMNSSFNNISSKTSNSINETDFQNMSEEEIKEFVENSQLNVGKGSLLFLIPILIFFVIIVIFMIFAITHFLPM